MLLKHIKQPQLLQEVGTELAFQLPIQEVDAFESCFLDLEQNKN